MVLSRQRELIPRVKTFAEREICFGISKVSRSNPYVSYPKELRDGGMRYYRWYNGVSGLVCARHVLSTGFE